MTPSIVETPAQFVAAPAGEGRSILSPRTGVQFGVAMLGAAAVTLECWPSFRPILRMIVEPLFGVSLWASIIYLYFWSVARTPDMQPYDTRALSRGLSGKLYLLLYGLVFARQALLVSRLAWRGDRAGLGLFQHGTMAAFERAVLGSHEAFPTFLVYGIAGLVVINLLGALHRFRAAP